MIVINILQIKYYKLYYFIYNKYSWKNYNDLFKTKIFFKNNFEMKTFKKNLFKNYFYVVFLVIYDF